jgi:hypothetical protein
MMKSLFLNIVLLSLPAFLPALAEAKDCEFVPKRSFCGVSLQANMKQFQHVLGKPSAQIELEHGWLYVYANDRANRMTSLRFSKQRLQEIRSWELNNNIDVWSQLPNREVIHVHVAGAAVLGRLRDDQKFFNSAWIEKSADQFGRNFNYLGAEIDVYFLPFYGPSTYSTIGGDLNNYAKYPAQTVIIRSVTTP